MHGHREIQTMITDKEQFEELCAAFALGALDKEEEALFDEALKNGNDEFQKIFRESIGVSYLINGGIVRTAPSIEIKPSLLRKIKQRRKTSISFSKLFERTAHFIGFRNPVFGLTVSLLLLIVIGEISTYSYMLFHEIDSLEKQNTLFESKIADQQLLLTTRMNDLEQKSEILNILQSSTLEIVFLSGQEANPSGFGKIIWDPNHGNAILHVSMIPKEPTDKDYQLWFLDKENNHVSADVFNISVENDNFYKIINIPLQISKEIVAFIITIEIAGGAQQPTGSVYLSGSITSNK